MYAATRAVPEVVRKGLGSPYAPTCAVLGAAIPCKHAGPSHAYDDIEGLHERIEEIAVRLKEYSLTDIDCSLQASMADILAYAIVLSDRGEACTDRRRLKQWVRSVFMQNGGTGSSITQLG